MAKTKMAKTKTDIINSIIVLLKELNDDSSSKKELNDDSSSKKELSDSEKVRNSTKIVELKNIFQELTEEEETINVDILIKDHEVTIYPIEISELSGTFNISDLSLVEDTYEPSFTGKLESLPIVKDFLEKKQIKLDKLRTGVKSLAKELEVDEDMIWKELDC